jgi:hypothetical protein
MKTSIMPACLVTLLLMICLAGCEEKSGDAVVIGKDRRRRETRRGIKDERATNHEEWILKVRMLDNGRRIEVHADRAQWEKLYESNRVRVTYRAGKYTGTVWDAEIN